MKSKPVAPDLFAGQPVITSSPKFTPKLPTTPTELAHVQAQLWETAPRHLRGLIRGENCIYLDALWQPIAKLSAEELVSCFSLQ